MFKKNLDFATQAPIGVHFGTSGIQFGCTGIDWGALWHFKTSAGADWDVFWHLSNSIWLHRGRLGCTLAFRNITLAVRGFDRGAF